jgi:hypothetical protein
LRCSTEISQNVFQRQYGALHRCDIASAYHQWRAERLGQAFAVKG